MAKRGNGEGSIRHRANGQWEARYTAPDGHQHSLYGKTRAEASRRLTEVLRDLGRGLPPPPERQMTRDFLAHWLMTRKPPVLEFTTWSSHEQIVRLHINPLLGRTPLAHLTAEQIQHLLATKLAAGSSPQTVKLIYDCLHKALNDAWRLGLVQRNVADLVKPPKVPKREMLVYSTEQAKALLAYVKGGHWEGLYTITLYSGMREGELLGLRWRDVDLDKGVLRLQTQYKARAKVLGRPKTDSGRRAIPLVSPAVAALRAHRVRQKEERLKAGPLWKEHDLVFSSLTGSPITNLRRSHIALLKRADLPWVRFHDLRHTTGTLLLEMGVDASIVAALLGHSSASVTQDVYQHVMPHMVRSAVEALERLLADEDKGSATDSSGEQV